MEILWYDNPYGLNQDNQATGFCFSFINPDGRQVHEWVLCRDYLHDVVRTTLTGSDTSIYGFDYGPDCDSIKLNIDKMRMLVSSEYLTNTTENDMNAKRMELDMMSALSLIHHYEEIAGVSKTRLEQGFGEGRHWWMFEGEDFWLKHPALVSMYTLLIRVGNKRLSFCDNQSLQQEYNRLLDNYENSYDEDNDNDVQILEIVSYYLDKVAKNATLLLDGPNGYSKLYYKDIDIHGFHDDSGIQSLCSSTGGYSSYTGDKELAKKVLEV